MDIIVRNGNNFSIFTGYIGGLCHFPNSFYLWNTYCYSVYAYKPFTRSHIIVWFGYHLMAYAVEYKSAVFFVAQHLGLFLW